MKAPVRGEQCWGWGEGGDGQEGRGLTRKVIVDMKEVRGEP